MTPTRKHIVKSLFHGSKRAFVRNCFKNNELSNSIINKVGEIVQQEVATMCSSLKVSSVLQLPLHLYKEFSWNSLCTELKKHAPVLFQLPLVHGKRRHNSEPEITISTVVAIICKQRCNSMSLLEKLLSICLYANHTSKQVLLFNIKHHNNPCAIIIDVHQIAEVDALYVSPNNNRSNWHY